MKKLVARFAWEYAGHCPDGQPFFISNINVWSQKWNDQHQSISFICPVDNVNRSYNIYTITDEDGNEIKFAATEYSNCFWGFVEYVDRLKKYKGN